MTLGFSNGNGLAIHTFNVWVGWCNASIPRAINLIPLFIDKASSSFVSGLEADFTFQSLDLLVIEEVAVLISVLDLFFAGEYVVPSRNRWWRYSGGRL